MFNDIHSWCLQLLLSCVQFNLKGQWFGGTADTTVRIYMLQQHPTLVSGELAALAQLLHFGNQQKNIKCNYIYDCPK